MKGRITHGHTVAHELSPTYISWVSMRSRCKYPNRARSEQYFLRGISVCKRWEKFENFLADMGERPPHTSIDRIDHNKNYEPSNCRWATQLEQARNRTDLKLNFTRAVQVGWLRMNGYKGREIAEVFNISESLPREISKGRVWKDAKIKIDSLLRTPDTNPDSLFFPSRMLSMMDGYKPHKTNDLTEIFNKLKKDGGYIDLNCSHSSFYKASHRLNMDIRSQRISKNLVRIWLKERIAK